MPAAAKQGDTIQAADTHVVMVPAPPSPPVPTPTPFPFNGPLTGGLSGDVFVEGMAAATVGSTADNTPPHFTPPPTFFQKPPTNRGTVTGGSGSVLVNGKAAARHGDRALTCNDPADKESPAVVSTTATVFFG